MPRRRCRRPARQVPPLRWHRPCKKCDRGCSGYGVTDRGSRLGRVFMFEATVHTVPIESPDDVSSVAALFDQGVVDPAHVTAIIAQTEGDGHARGYAALSLQLLFAE